MRLLLHVSNIILSAIDDDGNDAGDVKVPSDFSANRASNFVLEHLSTYEIAPPCLKYHS